MSDWKVFQGNGIPDPTAIARLPEPPKWRQFGDGQTGATKKQRRGQTFQTPPEAVELVNAALYLRRPLLVTGKPGTGKTSLAYAVAYELQLGEVLNWPITTRSTLKDGLYRYDAIGRLQEAQRKKDATLQSPKGQGRSDEADIGNYIQLGPLGTALLPSEKPRVLLIDEIDKSDIDLPNDLLNVFEEGEFEIPELVRLKATLKQVEVRTAYTDVKEETKKDLTATIPEGRVQCCTFPLVILTSNGEREFPPPFLRRCLRLDFQEPDQEALEKIVEAHLDDLTEEARELIANFLKRRSAGDLATDQLLNAIYLVTRNQAPEGEEKQRLIDRLLKYLSSIEDA